MPECDPESSPSPASIAADFDSAAATLATSPEDAEALTRLVTSGVALGGNAAVLRSLERLETLIDLQPELAMHAARTRLMLGFPEAAIEVADRVIGRAPTSVANTARRLKVQCLLQLGRVDDAERATADLIRRGLGTMAVKLLAQIDLAKGERERAVARLRPLVANPTVGDQDRMALGFDLAKALDKSGEHDEAFTTAAAATAIRAAPFDVAAFEAETEAIAQTFSTNAFAGLPRSTRHDERPVFIVGMPRSGTTLLEQIIDAHPEAVGVGERREFELAAHLLAHRTGRAFPDAIAAATTEQLDDLADLYLGMLDDLAPRLARATTTPASHHRRVVNKALNLDRLVGLIARTLPGARVIVLRRNPLDNLVSIHLNPLSPESNPWVGSMEGIIAARRRFDRLVDHWKATVDIPVLDLAYEDLVSDPETRIREVLDFLDLPFDERCLAFHSTGRVVMTPSANQVDQPMNTRAVARWRRYEKHLGPAIEAFPDAVG